MTTSVERENLDHLAPGVTVEVRDEQWLVTNVARTTDGFRLKVRGLSDYVRDTTATFFTALDTVKIFDPSEVVAVPDHSPHFRHSMLWLESTMRQTPVPMQQPDLEVATRMLADPLDYQLAAVRKALDPQRVQPRVLLADAVGLGKTLEIGMIVAELMRRGRGDRILVVTPKHVLEQFQQELWTRFAIPLVRLDSQGIQRVRQKLPSSKNPFTYFPRVIVSMDTLKSAKYRAQLEKVNWDIVVVDEIHNATNSGTQNNQLIRTLAPRTESLILASATPHNGNPESFKEILRLLDPLAVSPSGRIDKKAMQDLIIRRHRHSPEVAAVVGKKWATRLEPKNVLVEASDEENAVAAELQRTWLGQSKLFPWTLMKAFLSSPAALRETINNRLKRPESAQEKKDLQRLAELNDAVTVEQCNKYYQLVNYLQDEVGISKKSPNRVVIFSERVATLGFLQENLSEHLKLPKGAVKTMHGGMSDIEQMEVIDEFKRSDTPLRVLVTGDVASEGVNLHAQCHHLVHYDIPWSLIRIQQRNGRIDRYGQAKNPQITTLLLDPQVGVGETHVLTKLIEREHAAHETLGDVASLMGQHTIHGEEDQIRKVLAGLRDLDQTVRTPEQVIADAHSHVVEEGDAEELDDLGLDDFFASLSDIPAETTPPDLNPVRSLYPTEKDYLVDALDEAFHGVPTDSPAQGGVSLELHDNDILELTPPADLRRRFDFLPQDYVDYRQVKERLMLATSVARGESQLRAAREGKSEKSWPKAHFLGPLHPVSDWAADRALSSMRKAEIPAFEGAVDQLTVFLMSTLTSSRGQVVTRSFAAAHAGPFGMVSVNALEDPVAWLKSVGLSQEAISTGQLQLPEDTPELIRQALKEAEANLDFIRSAAVDSAKERVNEWLERADEWDAGVSSGTQALFRSQHVVAQQRELLVSSIPERTLIRPLAVIVPTQS